MSTEHHMTQENKEAWVKTQQKTFTKWCNNHLKKKGFPVITDAEKDFENGILLMQLLNALYGAPLPKYNANPKMRPHMLDNIELAFKMVEELKIKTNFLKHVHLVDHDLKMILGMLWSVILDYAIKGISEDDTTAKEGLLLWCRKKTAGYDMHIEPNTLQNFSSQWRNGMAFCALIHRHQPHLLDYASLDHKNAQQNIELAFSVAESLGIPRLLDAEDLLCDKPDERSVMTQVAEYFHRFSSQAVLETAARRAEKFLQFTRRVNQLKFDYESSTKELLDWVQSVIERFQNENFGETLEDSIAVNDRLRSYILNEKPAKTALKMDLEVKFAEIQTFLRVNNRPAYDVPAEFSPEQIDAAFDSLWSAEKAHATKARERRFGFVTKQEEKVSDDTVKEFTDSYMHFDKDGDGKLDRVEFKAALSAMSIPVKDDAALTELLHQVADGADVISLEQWIKYNTDLATDRDTPEQITQSFRVLAKERDTIDASDLRVPPLTDADVEYLASAMPQAANGGLDYKAFVESSFLKQ